MQIYVSCGKITESFELTVTDKTEETEEIIPVTDIDISDYEKELEVTKTMTLSATVVPANASESMIRYMSSNPAVAAVNSTGEIRGIATGDVVIYCSAGNITKEVPVTVKVATQKLSVNKDYLIMKPGNTIELKTSVLPKEACQNITYQSVDTEVAEVSSNGVVTAKNCGSTCVIVSNKDSNLSVSVIVNEGDTTELSNTTGQRKKKKKQKIYPEHIRTEKLPVITCEMLKYYYENEKDIEISGEGYRISMKGSDICNYKNELYTGIIFEKEKNGIKFEINRGKELCGDIKVTLTQYTGKYLYLYNHSKKRYQRIETDDCTNLYLSQPGTYLLTDHRIETYKIRKTVFLGGIAGLVILSVIYIAIRRKYWFW